MTMLVTFLLTVLVVLWLRRRSRTKSTNAGLNSDRPVFYADPPTRRVSRLKDERL